MEKDLSKWNWRYISAATTTSKRREISQDRAHGKQLLFSSSDDIYIYVLMCTMNSTMYDCIQMENNACVRLIYQPKLDTRRLIHRSGNAATRLDIIKSAGFNARIQLDGLNMYKNRHILQR